MRPLRAKPIELLRDADPLWIVSSKAPEDGRYMGVLFECPIHSDGCYVGVPFSNPVGGGEPEPMHVNKTLWQRTGEGLDTLTLSPSIKVLGGADGCEWHGFIRAGRFETCPDSR
jgi:hypothetical protein